MMAMSIVIADRPLAIPKDKAFLEAMTIMNRGIPMCIKIKRDDCWRARLSLKFWTDNMTMLKKAGFRETWVQR